MDLYKTVMDWLNDEPQQGPSMQMEGCFALVSWRDQRINAVAARAMSFRNMGMATMLAVGIPLLLLA